MAIEVTGYNPIFAGANLICGIKIVVDEKLVGSKQQNLLAKIQSQFRQPCIN